MRYLALLALGIAACDFPKLPGFATGGGSSVDAGGGPPSCMGLAMTCGPSATSDCCASSLVPGNAPGARMAGGVFYRSYDLAADAQYQDKSYPATVSDFRLDTYEVSVGRFRAFVSAGMGTQASPPAQGAGAHAMIPASGWDSSFDSSLASTTAQLEMGLGSCSGLGSSAASWTDLPGGNEDLPINCVSWFEALAFCIWDGGYLPTEAEWNYAASGGSDQRAYPWSNPPGLVAISCLDANYDVDGQNGYCVNGTAGSVERVGSASPTGDGPFGQADLAGNVAEWMLDWYASPYSTPCNDCADLIVAPYRAVRGGAWNYLSRNLRVAARSFSEPALQDSATGLRCAREP
jgi:formylglycine-generating enzyme required for sulfatase activity